MNNLLHANFARLWKTKVFWGCFVFMIILGAIIPLVKYNDMIKYETIYKLDNTFFTCAPIISIVSAVLCSLFIGTEYSDGTIRNKIIAGYSRSTIYVANLLTVITANIIFCTAFFATHFIIGFPLLGFFFNRVQDILILIISVYLLGTALCSVFTFFAMLISNKAIVAIISIIFSIILLIIGSILFSRLNEPSFIPANTSTNGSPLYHKDTPNPRYLVGTERLFYEFLYSFILGGQMIQFASMQVTNPYILSLYSCIIFVFISGIGISIFKKKDIR